MDDEVIALCFSCKTTFTTNEELLVHSCANIKDEKNELEDKNKLNFIDKEHQKNFEYEISLLDFSDNDDSAWQFYDYVRKYIKNLGITFQVSNKLTSAVKEGLRLWLKVDILNKKELEFATNFAKKVPLWYKKAKSDTRLFAAHQRKNPFFSDFRLRVSCAAS